MKRDTSTLEQAELESLSDRRVFDILKRTPMAAVNVGGAVQLKLLG